MKHLTWGLVTLAAFLAGLLVGPALDLPWQAATPDDGGAAVAGAAPEQTAVAGPAGETAPEPVGSPPAAGAAGASSRDTDPLADWPRVLERIHRLARSGAADAAAALQQQVRDAIVALARAGRPERARALLADYLAANPQDGAGLLADADLRLMEGRNVEALDPLLSLLQFADEPELIRQAREKLRLVVNVHETGLLNRRDFGALVRFYEDLVARDPRFDGHRLALARWLLRSGRAREAQAVLDETGLVGVDPAALADLQAQVRLSRTGLPVEQADGALHVRASAGGAALRLLVDTGATTTALSRERALSLAAEPAGERVRVRTAGGLVAAEIYRLRDVEVGPLYLEVLPVLVLDQPLPDGVDGLLGMDVLGRFPGVGAGLVPTPPR
jgi:clan AA aspartic protease (TIGR02281 family)